jgi:protein phosphatase
MGRIADATLFEYSFEDSLQNDWDTMNSGPFFVPRSLVPFSLAAATDTGRMREANEDTLIADARLGLVAVADGLGGHQGGEVASQITIDTITEFIDAAGRDPDITWPFGVTPGDSFEGCLLRNAIMLANRQIRRRGDQQPELAGMGSTVIAALLRDRRAAFVCVGDSRLYRWRDASLAQVSEDDTWIAAMIKAGASADTMRHHKMRHMLTKALGSVADIAVTARVLSLQPGEVLLLCSDGLYGAIGDDGIAMVMASTARDLSAAATALVDAANAAGGPDNITVVLARQTNEVGSGHVL